MTTTQPADLRAYALPVNGAAAHLAPTYDADRTECGRVIGETWSRHTEWTPVPVAGARTLCRSCIAAARKIDDAAAHMARIAEEDRQRAERLAEAPAAAPAEVEETADECVDRILAANPTVARKIARTEERARHEQAATAREVERLARSSEPGWGMAQRALVVDGVDHVEQEAADAVVEADVPPTVEERVTVPIRARELRAGDEVVDSLGARQYAAFDVQTAHALTSFAPVVRVWTAIRDQEAGLPPVITVPAERELLVLRPLSEEGRELLAALDRI